MIPRSYNSDIEIDKRAFFSVTNANIRQWIRKIFSDFSRLNYILELRPSLGNDTIHAYIHETRVCARARAHHISDDSNFSFSLFFLLSFFLYLFALLHYTTNRSLRFSPISLILKRNSLYFSFMSPPLFHTHSLTLSFSSCSHARTKHRKPIKNGEPEHRCERARMGKDARQTRRSSLQPHVHSDLPSLLLEAVEPLSWQYMITHSLVRAEHITYGRWRTQLRVYVRAAAAAVFFSSADAPTAIPSDLLPNARSSHVLRAVVLYFDKARTIPVASPRAMKKALRYPRRQRRWDFSAQYAPPWEYYYHEICHHRDHLSSPRERQGSHRCTLAYTLSLSIFPSFSLPQDYDRRSPSRYVTLLTVDARARHHYLGQIIRDRSPTGHRKLISLITNITHHLTLHDTKVASSREPTKFSRDACKI